MKLDSALRNVTIFTLTCLTWGPVPASGAEKAAAPAAEAAPATSQPPPDINGRRTVIAPPEAPRGLKVAIYAGTGASSSGVDHVKKAVAGLPGGVAVIIPPEHMATVDLSSFDVVVFGGGGARSQAGAVGEAGLKNVREFVREGGGYVGICAGAYLACTGFDWSLGILNARTVSSRWKRGSAYLDMQVTEAGRPLLGPVKEVFKVRYNNGPVIQPDKRDDLPAYRPVALFRSEVAENGSPAGIMVDSPAAATATFGQGRVFISSPHPENTPGLEHLIPRALLWAAGSAAAP